MVERPLEGSKVYDMNSIFALLTIGFVLPTKDIVIAGIALAVIILVAALLLFRSTGKGKAGKNATGGGATDWQQQQPGMGGSWGQPNMGGQPDNQWSQLQQPAANVWDAPVQQPGGWGQQQQQPSATGWGAPGAPQQPGAWGPQQQQPGAWGQQQQPASPGWGASSAQQPAAWDPNQQHGGAWNPQQQPAANAWNAPVGQQQQPATSWGAPGAPSTGIGNQQSAWDATSLPQQPQQQVPAWGMQANSASPPQQQAPTGYGANGSGQSWGQTPPVAPASDVWGQQAVPAQQGGWGQPFQQQSPPSPVSMPNAGGNPAMPPWQQQNGMVPEAATMFSGDNDKTMLRSTGPQGTLGFVRVEEGKEPGRVYEIRKNELSIGRSRESDIFLEDLAVSRLHAKILNMGNGVYALKDEGSANGTKVNGQVVNKYQNYPLQEGDKVQLGQTVLVFSKS